MALFGNATTTATNSTTNLGTTSWTSPTERTTSSGSFIEQPGVMLLLMACISAGLWLIYLTLYHARILGFALTRFVNFKYVKDGYFKVGSISFSILSGKVMFRDVRYITKDLSIRVVDGFVFFKYWMPFEPVDCPNKPYQHTLADIETAFTDFRLSVWLNGLEYHVYNRSQLYNRLKEIFNIDRYGDAAKSVIDLQAESKVETTDIDTKESSQGGLPTWFLELVPAIKIDLSIGKVAFGNKNMETTLCFHFESATGMYTTAQASSAVDHFTHVVKCHGKNVKIMLSPSPGYNGPRDEPPRYMGEGFVVLQTADCKIMYYQDEPGIVAELKPEDDINIPDSDPHWGVDVAFIKGTSLSYGPWVDRQRDFLQKFFFPMDFQEMPATKPFAPGQRRIHTGVDIKFDFECDASLDILFSKNRETKAVHVCVDSGSYIRVYQPWTVNEYGYTTSVVAKLLQVEATTGLEYRSLFEADSLDLAVHMAFPRVWNQTQHWTCDITVSKVSWYFIFAHKWFFQDMIEDWSSNYRADLLHFVPYEWAFNIVLKDFEMIWLANQHNWIDTTTGWQGNAELAFCGELFDLTFALQFFRFLPEIEEIKFFLQVEKLIARTAIPESNTLRRSFLSLARSHEKRQNLPFRSYSTNSTSANPEEGIESSDENPAAAADGALSGGWRRHTSTSTGWVDVMSVPVLGLSLGYVYHPVLPNPCVEVPKDGRLTFDPYDLESDVITLELEAGPAALMLFGPLLKVLAAIKENYFGIDQVFHEFGTFSLSKKRHSSSEGEQNKNQGVINPYLLRPLEANIYVSLYDCKAQLAKHCGQNEPTCPLLLFERMMFEMHKTYTETRLQLHLTPLTLLADDGLERGGFNSHLSRGHLCLSGFQVRGHAMFSGEGLPVGSETLEYGWLVELQFGIVTGKVTLPQLESIANWLQTFAFHVVNKENELDPVTPYQRCIHGNQQNMCKAGKKLFAPPLSTFGNGGESSSAKGRESAGATPQGTLEKKTDHVPTELCLTEDDLKYKFTRVSIENVNLFFVESGCACNLEIAPIRLATCNLHNNESSAGASLFIHTVKLRQFVLTPCPNTFEEMLSNVQKRSSMYEQDVTWLEAASIQLGPVISDISMATSSPNRYHQQKHFLEMHDKGFQRLWFLWQPDERYSYKRHGCCGCVGGCSFFGRNANGPKFFMPGKLDASENDTGVTGFGSEDGFYEDGDLVDVSSRPLMYSRDGSLDGLDSVMDRTPVGSIEAFTRRRYKHCSDSTGSPRLPRATPQYLGPSPPYSFTEGGGAGEEEDGSRRTSRISFDSSLHRANSSLGNIQERMRYMHNASLQGSKHSLERNNKASKTAFNKPPKHRSLSQLSRESDASFYSCGSLLDEIGMNQRDGIRRTTSVDSFVSAVEDPIELMDFEDGQVSLSKFVINSPELVSKYSRHLAQLDCLNWAASSLAPGDRKKFSLTQNIKEMMSEEPNFLPPGIPQFNYQNSPKLSFPLLVKKSQKKKDEGEAKEDDGASSSSDGSVFMYHETTLKVPTFHGKDIDKGKYDGSSEMIEQTEQDSTRKARWSFAMNTSGKEGLSCTSSFDNMLDGVQNRVDKKLPKEGTAVIKVAGDVNILVTPLLLEALQRYIFSVEKKSGVLHPATVVDLVHDKCMDAAEQAFLARVPEPQFAAGEPHMELTAPQRDTQGDKTTLVFLSTSKINICFLQAASPDSKLNENVDAQSPDSFRDKNRTPTVSLLAGTISGITSEVMNVKNRTSVEKPLLDGHEEVLQQDKLPKVSLTDPQGHSFEERTVGKKSGVIEHVSTVGVVSCNSVQFQLRKLCDKSDIENSVTTAIPEEASRAKFKVNGSNQIFYSRRFDIDSLEKSQSLSLLMLECGVDNITIEAGSEYGSGSQVLSKINRNWISNKQNGFIPKEQVTATTPPKQDRQEFHGFSNPIFERDTGSVAININLPESQRKSQDTLSQNSSVSATISLSSSSSGGNISDVESDSDQEMRKPLLSPDGGTSSKSQTDEKIDAEVSDKEPECAQRNDILVKFSNIWVNLASPSSFKAVPANYHLYNSLVTTAVPVVTAWAPLVAGLGEAVAAMECNRKRHISSVIACLLAQALPDGRLPGKHSVCPRATDVAKFIQEDYSSQLIFILRRQLSGSRLAKVRNALLIKSGIPDDSNLVKGIFALARQWKCFLAGTEKGELAFDGSNSIKRRIVGRGVLTDRDRAILMQEESQERDDSKTPRHQPSQVAFSQQSYVESSHRDGESEPLLETQEDQGSGAQVDHSQKGTQSVEVRQAEQEIPIRRPSSLPIPQDPNSIRVSPRASRHSTSKLLQPEPAHDSDSDSDATPPSTIRKPLRSGPNESLHAEHQKLGHKKQLSLYSWLSNTPTTSPPSLSSQARTATHGENVENAATKAKVQIIDERLSSPNSNMFGDMVSVPTSGKQIADERDIFKSLFQSIQLMPAPAKDGNSACTISVSTKFKYLNVDLVEGGFDNLSKKVKENESKSPKKFAAPKQLFTDHEPVFMAKDFAVKLVCDMSPTSVSLRKGLGESLISNKDDNKLTQVRFTVSSSNITQRVNLSFVRLLIQIVDMLDLLLEPGMDGAVCDELDGPSPRTRITSSTPSGYAVTPQTSALSARSPVLPKCWRIMYQVLDLYSSLPKEAKVKGFMGRSIFGATGFTDRPSPDRLKEIRIDMEDGNRLSHLREGHNKQNSLDKRRSVASYSTRESKSTEQEDTTFLSPSVSIFGVVSLPKTRFLATIGGLILETEIKDIGVSISHKEEKVVGSDGPFLSSVLAHLGKINLVLLEKTKIQTGTVVSCHLSRSQAMYTAASRVDSERNMAVLTLGVVDIDIPQHPVALHSMMTRSSRTISRHISEIQSQRSVIRSMGSYEAGSPRISRQLSGVPTEFWRHRIVGTPTSAKLFSTPSTPVGQDSVDSGVEPSILTVSFTFVFRGFALGAALLPSLRAEYKIGQITSSGQTGTKSSFKVSMPQHNLSFTSKIQAADINVPSSTVVELPPVNVSGEFLSKVQQPHTPRLLHQPHRTPTKGHLFARAEIGAFQHSLTTDLLNHLVFVQKSFMKEVSDVVQRVSGESQPVPLWRTASAESLDPDKGKEMAILYSFELKLKGIQVTATTPSSTAVRLDTGVMALEVSNALPPAQSVSGKLRRSSSHVRLFGKAQVDVNLSLGQFVKSRVIEEESDFQQLAYFKTRIGLRNSFQDGSSMRGTEDKETFLVTLTKPYLYIQQISFDKAVLVYLNYKNAYEHWNKQRLALNKEVHTATQVVLEKLPQRGPAAQLSGSLFLQLTVDRLGVCTPLFTNNLIHNPMQGLKSTDQDPGPAIVLTVEEMLLSCCSSMSFVSRGKFKEFCIRFEDKFSTEATEWEPSPTKTKLMNTCKVPEGTYELCSKTIRYPATSDAAKAGKWVMSIHWQMRGIEVECDTEIGKYLSSLGQTLTTLAGETDIANMESVTDIQEQDRDIHKEVNDENGKDEVDAVKQYAGEKYSMKSLEKEMWDQARKVNELRRRSDIENWVVEKETIFLQELESAVFNEFRRDVRKKLRRHSRATKSTIERRDSDKRLLHGRKAVSEHVRGSRTRSRLRKRSKDVETDGEENEMVEMTATSAPSSPGDVMLYLNGKDFRWAESATDEQDGMACSALGSSGRLSPSFPDVARPSQLLEPSSMEDPLPYPSTPHVDGAASSPRVTFSTGSSDTVQDQTGQRPSTVQQNLDFELDVKVDIESGLCILHPATDPDKEPDATDARSHSKRSTPVDNARSKTPGMYFMGQRRYKKDNQEKSSQPDDTVLFLPAVDVRVQYHSGMNTSMERDRASTSGGSFSHPLFEESSSMISTDLEVDSDSSTLLAPPSADQDSTVWDTTASTMPTTPCKRLIKRAGLYTWISFQSLPQKMVLKPCLLDFLGQALEPIVPAEEEFVDAGESLTSDADSVSGGDHEATGSMVSSSMSENSSFPVDIVVVIRVQPSEIRFSCLPVSRVECMLNFPDLDVVFSSNSSPNKYLQQSSNRPPSRDQSRLRIDQLDSSSASSFTFDSGGISFTVCLSRLSFCIFHPYGKEHDGMGRTPSTDEDATEEGGTQMRFVPTQAKSGKKDSLSLNVEFIKFNLSRRRLGKAVDFPDDKSTKSGSSDFLGGSSVVKVSGICDIGSANFYYDMRRLNEILDFPKAWYKRSLISRLFLGKEGVYATRTATTASTDVTDAPPTVMTEEPKRMAPLVENPSLARVRPTLGRSMSEEDPKPLTPLKSPLPKKTHKKVPSTGSSLFGLIPTSPSLFRSVTMSGTRHGLLTPGGPVHSSPTPRRQTFSGDKIPKAGEHGSHPPGHSSSDDVDGPMSHSSTSSSGGSKTKWETMIVVALNLSRLDVTTNMSSVMGQTFWSTSDLRATGRLTLTNTGRRNLKAKLTIRQAKCGSRSGIVGGHIEVYELLTRVKANEERGYTPEHLVNVSLKYAEARIDYMGTCIWMGNLSAFRTDLRDEWILHQATSPSTDSLFGSERKEPVNAKIYMHGELAWNDFKVMICRSTTPDFVKMTKKIQDFFAQQHRNSMRALSSLHTPSLGAGSIMSQLSAPITSQSLKKAKAAEKDGLKYQHWSKVLNAVCGLQLSTLSNPLPERGVLLGGSLSLRGQSVSLACFHGVNFRAQSWVLFTLCTPFMEFSSRVCSVEKSCQVRRVRAVQNLLIRIGHGDVDDSVPGNLSPTSAHMAIVRKVSRGRRNPPSMGSHVQEWLNYVCATGDEDFSTTDDTSSTERPRTDSTGSLGGRKSSSVRRTSSSYRYEHETEPIFALPKFEVVLKTEHDLPMSAIPSTWARNKKVSLARMMATPSSPHVVECSFTSCFDDSLCVTMDVGLLFFLHDVVQTYIRENETTSSGGLPRGTSPNLHSRREDKMSKEDRESARKTEPEPKSKRTRQFRSKAWKLEPRVRFMSWAGKNMEPVNIDWVLQKLGFTDAQLTIPKWAQRGAMDPMDLFLSLLIDRLLAGMQESSTYLEDV